MQIALGRTAFSEDGKLMAYTLSSGGSDWVSIKVLTVDQDTGATTHLEDKLEYVKFSSLAWTHDHKVSQQFFNIQERTKCLNGAVVNNCLYLV